MAAATTDVEDFLAGPLVAWLCSCLENVEQPPAYEDLIDGVLLHQVLLQIDPEPMHRGIVPSLGNTTVRVRNLDIILKNIKTLYEEELCQVLLVMPDCVRLAHEPDSQVGLENAHLLLLLLLGCAVQCPNKKRFIDRITEMDVEQQHAIVDCIKQVTDSHQIVLPRELPEVFSLPHMEAHLRRLARERDEYLNQWVTSVTAAGRGEDRKGVAGGGNNPHHVAVELADWKSRLRKQRQELEEKSESLAECREELEATRAVAARLRQEVQEQMQDARSAKAYRDELDVVKERADRVDKLEAEVQRYREKLSDIEFYKTRVEELREDNKVLLDTREMLEEQLQRARKRGDHLLDLESELLKYKQHVNELTLDREADQEKLQELFEENAQLQLVAKSAARDRSISPHDLSLDRLNASSGDNSLSEQLSSNAQARALRLELENRRLVSQLDDLKANQFHDAGNKILELEKDKKRMAIKVQQVQDNYQRMTQQNAELEVMFKNAMAENGKLHDAMERLRANGDRLENDVSTARGRLGELEGSLEEAAKDKQRMQLMQDVLQRRLGEQERAALQAELWRGEAQQLEEVKAQHSAASLKIEAMEREALTTQRELARLREQVEEKDVALDSHHASAALQDEATRELRTELATLQTQVTKLQEVERESQELSSRAAVDKQTLGTLQSDLVAQKLTNEQYKRVLEKLGLNLDELVDCPDLAIERMVSRPEVLGAVRELLSREQTSLEREEGEGVRAENAALQVNVAMLQSQISALSSQHLALQLANSQLAVEKEELVKTRGLQLSAHEQLLLDQVQLQSLHEQLAAQYEGVASERESLRAALRDTRHELRTARDACVAHEAAHAALEQDRDGLKVEARSLANLRAEHSSLKDDFRNLFSASERLKGEYRTLQEEYRALRGETGSLKLRHTELQGEAASRADHTALLEVELSKLTNRCEMLSQMNSGLEDDRRSLMDHVSLLLTQYHELLTHSLEDKEHFHTEEKLFTDKVNNLCRQKEKLEEKIMEHYRKLDSCSTKKKSFGATLVKRVRKAGSDLINKVPRNRRSSWLEESQQTSQVTTSQGEESDEAGSGAEGEGLGERDSFARSSLSLAGAGTRRAVYFTEDGEEGEGEQYVASPTEGENNGPPCTSTPQQPDNKPYLVYNRISTVIGGGTTMDNNAGQPPQKAAPSPPLSTHSSFNKADNSEPSKGKGKGKGENSIWYEYGCV